MKRHKGFTLMELLIVVGMIGMLATLVIPTLSKARDLVKRTKCASNMNAIGVSLLGAAAEEGSGRLPHAATGQNVWNVIGDKKTASYDPDGVMDGTRPLFSLMVRTRATVVLGSDDTPETLWVRERVDLVKPDVFLCPAVSERDSRLDLGEWQSVTYKQVGFEGAASCHYAYQHCLNPGRGDERTPVVSLIDDARKPILADRSPMVKYISGEPSASSSDNLADSGALETANSPNHKGDGQNILRLNGSVRFEDGVVINGDNIWQPEPSFIPDPDSTDEPPPQISVARSHSGAGYDEITGEPKVFLVP